ncbi:MAG: asparaginase [Candidatus Niyogibacteria bacterium]|nr:asparaginase [Candidatus Niyogibacteria bacterium]
MPAVIAVGGTIDAQEYNFEEGKVITFGDPAVKDILQVGRIRNTVTSSKNYLGEEADIYVLPQKDSLEMTDDDRMRLMILCLLIKKERILITHGTDTMEKTAEFLSEHILEKTVVLTGAMEPYRFNGKEASFNVGTGLMAAQTLPDGIYVAMHGRYFKAGRVRKNKREGYFEETGPPFDEKRDRQDRGYKKLLSSLMSRVSAKVFLADTFADGEFVVGRIPKEAGNVYDVELSKKELNDIPVKEEYYTAGYPPGSLERFVGPANHTNMWIVSGKYFGMKEDIFIASGNFIIGLRPMAFKIIDRGANDDWHILIGRQLSWWETIKVARKTKIWEKYRELESFGPGALQAVKKRNEMIFRAALESIEARQNKE